MLKRAPTDANGDIQAFLFDHAVLLVRVKTINKKEDLKVFRKPIPLELLVVAEMHDLLPNKGLTKRPSSGLSLATSRTQTMNSTASGSSSKGGHPLTFRHLGKGGYDITLYASTPIQQTKWIEHIDSQQRKLLKESSNIYTKTNLNEGFFNASNRINCCVPIGKIEHQVYS